jgi:outer membrane protein OmpA-like peptidoglycan-associated protein
MTKTGPISRRDVSSALLALGALTAGCVPESRVDDASSRGTTVPSAAATNTAAPSSAPAAPAASAPLLNVPPPVPFDQAIANAAHVVFTSAPVPDAGSIRIVIDPLMDGMTGYQSKATQSIQDQVAAIVRRDFSRYDVQRISAETLKDQPRVLMGTLTSVNADLKPAGEREAYRFCLVMGDLKTGKIIAKQVVRSHIEDPDTTPIAAFGDSPVWTDDPSIETYITTCHGSKVGDPIRQEFYDGLLAAALLGEADEAYDGARYGEALDLYTTARKTPAGDQLRVYNGIYLSLTKLGRTTQAQAAFRDLVDYGLRKKRLVVKFLFRPGSVRFVGESNLSGNYGMWLQQIASRAASSQICLQITGHTSPTGPAAMNDSLSLLRAEYVQSRLENEQPLLKQRTVAAGVGSRENLIGTGRDDMTDLLDRRVELRPIEPCV